MRIFIVLFTSIIISNYQKNHSTYQKAPYQCEFTPQLYSPLYLLRWVFFPHSHLKKDKKTNCIRQLFWSGGASLDLMVVSHHFKINEANTSVEFKRYISTLF